MTPDFAIFPLVRACLIAALLSATQAARAEDAPIPASAAPAVRADVPVIARGLGTVQPYQSVLIRARVDGTLERIAFIEGQEVNKGDLLAEIDPRPYQAALDQARAKKAADQAMLRNAALDLQRYANLAKSDFASRQSVDTQRATVAQQAAALEGDDAAIAAAQLNLDFCRITAPFDGRVGLRQVDPGALIHATDAQGIVVLSQIHPIAVLFTLPQDRLPAVQQAMARRTLPATARASDGGALLGTGTLLAPDNAIDASTGTIRLKAIFPNDTRMLWPGEFVNVGLRLDTLKDQLTIPFVAVQHGPDGLYVYRVKPDRTIEHVAITTGQESHGRIVALTGLQAGDMVVTDGQSRLSDGSTVALEQPAEQPAAKSSLGG